MKTFLVPLMALSLFGVPVFADHHGECKCDEKCMAACEKGESKDCKCDTCDCAKTGKCGHGKCEHHKDGKKEGAKKKK